MPHQRVLPCLLAASVFLIAAAGARAEFHYVEPPPPPAPLGITSPDVPQTLPESATAQPSLPAAQEIAPSSRAYVEEAKPLYPAPSLRIEPPDAPAQNADDDTLYDQFMRWNEKTVNGKNYSKTRPDGRLRSTLRSRLDMEEGEGKGQ